MPDKCYMCDQTATTTEHVPPKCLFPTMKDSSQDLRVNLFTVPSCDNHNGKKSKDDEFLMVSIAGILGNNSIGFQHYHGKIQRALKRNSFRLLEKVFTDKKIYRFNKDNLFIDVIWGTPDYNRLMGCFDNIALGVYRHHFGENFKGKVKSLLGFLHMPEGNPKAFTEWIKYKSVDELKDKEKYGDNPGVFYYQYTSPDQYGYFLIKLCFYENLDIYVAYLPQDVERPTMLEMELMNRGIKTYIHDGEKIFEFN